MADYTFGQNMAYSGYGGSFRVCLRCGAMVRDDHQFIQPNSIEIHDAWHTQIDTLNRRVKRLVDSQ